MVLTPSGILNELWERQEKTYDMGQNADLSIVSCWSDQRDIV